MNRYIILIAIVVGLIHSSCQSDFLDREPLDETSAEIFFDTPEQMRAYLNTFYNRSNFPKYANHGSDFNSDNEVDGTPDLRLQGTRVVTPTGSIDFSAVRSINFFFDNYRRVQANHSLQDYQQYLGEAYFFRALIYFNLMKSYGDIQIVTKELGPDSPELYNARDPRNEVADFIIGQLDSAALYLTPEKTSGAGRVNRWMALLIQSRVALYEGTWEKYHAGTDFGADDANPEKYLSKAVEAAEELIQSNVYEVYSTGNPEKDYKDLFSLLDYSSNSELMFWQNFDQSITQGNGSFTNDRFFRMRTPSNQTITKQLADSYLCIDGKPISGNPLFEGYDLLAMEAKNRDPRFYQTIATPDQVWQILQGDQMEYWSSVYTKLNSTADFNAPTGYIIQKGYNPNTSFHVQQYEESPGLIYRYAEALLNFVEAKAELGTLTQEDIDISIKKLRDRVGMPNLVLSDIVSDPNWDFPELSPVLNEIRRERRVELAAEGFRWDDIARWAAADELIVGARPKGFMASQIELNPFPIDENGFLDPYKNAIPNGYGFKLDRDYLNSIPESQIVLNDKLTQNPGW